MTANLQKPLLLLEIGTEEIPARFVTLGMSRLKEKAERLFSENRFVFEAINVYGTPRRLALIAELEEFQQPSEREIWGPPAHIAFDSSGSPTKAAESFAKNNGVAIEELQKKEKNKGTYIVAVVRESSLPVMDILPQVLQRLVLSINFPKSMRWGTGTVRFVRPIHWILSLYNNKKLLFEIEGIRSGNMTRGHRFLSPASFEMKDIRTYINLLRNNFVVIDREERQKNIVESARRLAQTVDAVFIEDTELIDHVTDLVEYPQAVLCDFDDAYLKLPEELLVTVMKDHQKYFALRNKQGHLTNHFIIISNSRAENAETVRKGAQKVIRARFEDARFYYEDDVKTPLNDRVEELKRVVYHERLGSTYEKTMRIRAIAAFIADRCCAQRSEDVSAAALVCKADLISGVVREFPELQGIMGGYYAANEGYNSEVAAAVREHYMPRHGADKLPSTNTGVVISMADKIDNLASFFSIGEIPSGTEDPFALRRQCYAIVSMLMEKGYEITAEEIFSYMLEHVVGNPRDGLLKELLSFFEQRFEFYMQNAGYEQDIVNSLIGYSAYHALFRIKQRADAIRAFKQRDYFSGALTALKRINNISPKTITPAVDESLLTEPSEIALYSAYTQMISRYNDLMKGGSFEQALELLCLLQAPINGFFDKVLVMDKREDVKQNRLALVKSIHTAAGGFADFSKLS